MRLPALTLTTGLSVALLCVVTARIKSDSIELGCAAARLQREATAARRHAAADELALARMLAGQAAVRDAEVGRL